MNTNIFRHEFLVRRQSLITWSVSVAALVLFFFSIFPAFSDQAALLDEMMTRFPRELLAAFGMGNISLASPLGYFSLVFLFVQLCLAIQASNIGFGLVSIEESELTADFLLSKPVSRPQVLISKMLAALSVLTITNLVVWAASFMAFALFRGNHEYDPGVLALLLLSILPFQLFYLSVGLVVSLLVRRVRSVTPYALGLGFGTYALSAFSGIFGDVTLELLTPFKHFDATWIVGNSALNFPLVLINLAVSLIALAASYRLYLRRDIPAVS